MAGQTQSSIRALFICDQQCDTAVHTSNNTIISGLLPLIPTGSSMDNFTSSQHSPIVFSVPNSRSLYTNPFVQQLTFPGSMPSAATSGGGYHTERSITSYLPKLSLPIFSGDSLTSWTPLMQQSTPTIVLGEYRSLTISSPNYREMQPEQLTVFLYKSETIYTP